MEAGLDDPTLLRSYPLASLTELGLCERTTFIYGFDSIGYCGIYCPYRLRLLSLVLLLLFLCLLRFPSPLPLPPTSTGNVLARKSIRSC